MLFFSLNNCASLWHKTIATNKGFTFVQGTMLTRLRSELARGIFAQDAACGAASEQKTVFVVMEDRHD